MAAVAVGGPGGGAGGSMGAMNRYITLQALGDGTYGSVMLGQRVDTGEKVRHQSYYIFISWAMLYMIYLPCTCTYSLGYLIGG